MRVEYHRSFAAMNTRFDVILRGEDEQHLEAVAVAVSEEIQRLDATLSRFNPSSEIARLNRYANISTVKVDQEIFALLERCECARKNTNGFFDIAAATGGAGIDLNAESYLVRFTDAVIQIDLGAIGKGYALDCGREILLRYGVTSGLLQGGTSSVLAIGDDEWPVDVRHPRKSEKIVQRLALKNCGFSCSAVRHADQLLSDVINPHSGEPLCGDGACVVLAENATDAEIFSTALLAIGQEKAKPFVDKAKLNIFWIDAAL